MELFESDQITFRSDSAEILQKKGKLRNQCRLPSEGVMANTSTALDLGKKGNPVVFGPLKGVRKANNDSHCAWKNTETQRGITTSQGAGLSFFLHVE